MIKLPKQLMGRLRQAKLSLLTGLALITALLGLSLRILLVILAGNQPVGTLSGTGDQIRYLTLADSIFRGEGFTYAGQPTALRPPLYPLLLAVMHMVFGSHYLFAVRVFQLLAGVALAYICLLLGSELFGAEIGAMAGALALALPSLVFVTAEVQTEALATFVTALFLYSLVGEIRGSRKGAVFIGITSGFAMLLRFNNAILPVVAFIVCLWFRRSLRVPLIVSSLAALIVAPWIVRNGLVFHGEVLYSSHGGINLLEGVLTPEGRAQGGETERLRAAVGWTHTDIEVNNARRLQFPSEDQLDKQARAAAIEAWKNLDWKSRLQLLAKKIVVFWLSTDQLFETSSFRPAQRMQRAGAVFTYWLVLALAFPGCLKLFSSSKSQASAIVFYAAFVTAAHLPFVMNTRLRIPFFDPLLVVLAAGGFGMLVNQRRTLWESRFRKQSAAIQQKNALSRSG